MHSLLRDAAVSVRSLRKSPLFTAVAVVSLALGIGANTAIFTLVDQLILRLLPVQHPEEIVLLAGRGRHYGGNNGRNALSYPMYQDIRDRNQVFSGMMCRYRLSFVVGVQSKSEVVGGELVSGNYFPLLGIRPAAGRLFTAGDDLHKSSHPYAVLSYSWWQSRFAGNPGVLGQTIRVNNYPLTVVGVSQPGFDGTEPGMPAQIFVPMAMAEDVRPGFDSMYNRRQRWVNVYGRLKPGVSIERAKAGLQPLFHQVLEMEVRQEAFRNATSSDKERFLRMWMDAMPGSQGNTNLRRTYETPLLVLSGVVGLVLLIACANLASLLTARAAARQREIAIRLAMGATRARMLQQLLTESTLLAIAGGVGGLTLSFAMAKGLLAFLPPMVAGYNLSSTPDLRVLAFTFGLSLATGLAFGLIPALQSTRPQIAPTLKDTAGNVMGARGQVRFRKALVAAQVALSLLLLIGAGLFIRSLSNLHSLNPGFQTTNLVQFSLVNPRSVGVDEDRIASFYQRMLDRLRAIPGVRSVGMATVPVLGNNEWDNWITIEGRPRSTDPPDPHVNYVSDDYFETLRIHVLEGRTFTRKDDAKAPKVAVVNAKFARKYFDDRSPIGHRIGQGGDPTTPTDIQIVGVVNDTRYENLREEIPEEVYFCGAQYYRFNNSFTVYVRTERAPESAFQAIRAGLHEQQGDVPVYYMKTLERQMEDSLVTERIVATLSSSFGALATVLAVIGLYGVMAFTVTRRSREIGIRMALGARGSNVAWLVMREVLALVGAGVAVGLPAAYALTRVVRAQLYGVEPGDAASLAGATALLAGVALLAGYAPARRAAGYDPVKVLRCE